MRYASRHQYTWSAAIAYSVGLMTSDGCLQRDGRHLDLTSVDIEQLENFSKALGRQFHIGRKKSGADELGYRVQFSDVAYYDFLLNAGLTPAKSKTMTHLIVPDEFFADFLRGLFDGDGTCYAYTDTRWRSSYMFYTSFASASPGFLRYIQRRNQALARTGLGALRTGIRTYNLIYAKADSRKLAEFMYYEPGLLALTRKRQKLEGFIKTDNPGRIP